MSTSSEHLDKPSFPQTISQAENQESFPHIGRKIFSVRTALFLFTTFLVIGSTVTTWGISFSVYSREQERVVDALINQTIMATKNIIIEQFSRNSISSDMTQQLIRYQQRYAPDNLWQYLLILGVVIASPPQEIVLRLYCADRSFLRAEIDDRQSEMLKLSIGSPVFPNGQQQIRTITLKQDTLDIVEDNVTVTNETDRTNSDIFQLGMKSDGPAWLMKLSAAIDQPRLVGVYVKKVAEDLPVDCVLGTGLLPFSLMKDLFEDSLLAFPKGVIYLMGESSYLIESSTDQEVFEVLDSGNGGNPKYGRLRAYDANNSVIRETAKYVSQNPNDGTCLNTVSVDGSSYYVCSTTFSPIEGSVFTLVLAIPRSDIFSITTATLYTMGSAVVLILIAALLSFFGSKLISRPVHQFQRQMERVATGDFSKGDWESPRQRKFKFMERMSFGRFAFLSEMANMYRAFWIMRSNLEMYTSKLDTMVVQKTEQLEKAKEAAVNANQAKSNFLANMSHEIRTPMHGIVNLTNFLLESPLNEEQREWAKDAHSATLALMQVLNDILDLSKVEAGKMLLECIEFDLLALMEEQSALYTGMAFKSEEKPVDVLLQYHPDLPTRMIGDPTRFRQILSNLLSNAFKFTHDGYILIRVAPFLHPPPEDYTLPGSEDKDFDLSESWENPRIMGIEVQVIDTGIGMTKEQTEQMFKHYTQADVSTTRKFGGTGLGLYIIKNLVEIFGGTISVESQSEVGSTFSFTIYLGVCCGHCTIYKNCNCTRCASSCPSSYGESNPIRVDSVLLAFPHRQSCKTIQLHLKELSNEWTIACSVEELWEKGKEKEWTVIVIDDLFLESGMEIIEDLQLLPTLQKCRFILIREPSPLHPKITSKLPYQIVKPIKPSLIHRQWQALLRGTPRSLSFVSEPKPQKDENEDGITLNVLVVEDNLVNQKVAKRILLKMNCDVSLSHNGLDGLNKVKESFQEDEKRSSFDIILMDVLMPKMDGYTAAREIRQWEEEKQVEHPLMIIALTAHAMVEDKDKCIESGMDGYLSKPLDSSLLQRYLDKLRGASDQKS